MTAAARRPMTIQQFLAWEEGQPLRHEFDGSGPVAMAGGTAAHAVIQANLAAAMVTRLRGTPCRFVGSDLKVETAGRIRYPDGFVYCSPFEANGKVITDPVVIFEVLSEATHRVDLLTKNQEYAATPSVKRYVVLAQDAAGGTVFERIGDDWVGHLLAADSVIAMPEIGITVPLTELYDGVTFAPTV